MRYYHDPFERLLAEVVCEVAEDLAKPQFQDFGLDISGEYGTVHSPERRMIPETVRRKLMKYDGTC